MCIYVCKREREREREREGGIDKYEHTEIDR